jgi:hypothetical protein
VRGAQEGRDRTPVQDLAGKGISSMPKEDEPGFDPFEEPDAFREEYPAHEPKAIAALILVDLLDPPAGSREPPAKDVKCGLCYKTFKARADWLFGKWRHTALCANCSDGITLPAGFLAECDRARVLQMSCPNCGLSRGVEARFRYNMWEYATDCANCGQHIVAYRRLRRRCTQCQEYYFVSDKRPKRTCHKCADKQSPY